MRVLATIVLILALLVGAAPYHYLPSMVGIAAAASCTFGTDCLRECVLGTGNSAACAAKGYPFNVSGILMVEDFECPTLRGGSQGVSQTAGAPCYGPPFANGGITNYRGNNGYWQAKYGTPTFCGSWAGSSGQPSPSSAPAFGQQCTLGICGFTVWHPTDLWNGNNPGGTTSCTGAFLAPMTQGSDFTSEVSALTIPTNTNTGTPGVFDGNASMGWRIQAGAGQHADLAGGVSFPGGVQRNFGYTGMHAYASNLGSTSILSTSWKHHEWLGPGVRQIGSGGDGLVMFFNGSNLSGIDARFPFLHFIFFGGFGEDQTSCQTHANSATKTVGTIACLSTATQHQPIAGTGTGQYDQATHWPLATWGCVRATFTNFGLSNSGVTITLTTPQTGNTERTILQISNWNLSATDAGQGFDGFHWDPYANANDCSINQGVCPHPTTQTTFRYDDNIVIKSGTPLTCAQIGYTGATGGGDTTPPAAPTNLHFGL